MDNLEDIKQKLTALEKKLNALRDIVQAMKVIDSRLETELKYIKLFLGLSIVLNGYVSAKLGLPIK